MRAGPSMPASAPLTSRPPATCRVGITSTCTGARASMSRNATASSVDRFTILAGDLALHDLANRQSAMAAPYHDPATAAAAAATAAVSNRRVPSGRIALGRAPPQPPARRRSDPLRSYHHAERGVPPGIRRAASRDRPASARFGGCPEEARRVEHRLDPPGRPGAAALLTDSNA